VSVEQDGSARNTWRARFDRGLERLRDRRTILAPLRYVALTLLLVWMYGASLAAHVKASRDPGSYADDARVWIYPFQRYHDPSLFAHDYLGDYSLACMAPGFRALYWVLAHFWDPRSVSKVVPYVLLAVVVGAVAASAAKWGKAWAAWFAAALVLSSDAVLERLTGGLPRAFGFPIVALAIAALVHGRVRMLAIVTAIGAAFYPVAAMPGGIALAGVMLLLPAKNRGEAATWSFKKRFAWVAGTAVAAAILLAPTSLALRKYGGYITPADIAAYPEAGPGGRYEPGDRPPYPTLAQDIASAVPPALTGAGVRWTDVLGKDAIPGPTRKSYVMFLLGFAVLAMLRLTLRDESARRAACFVIAAAVGHYLAWKIPPWLYLPKRYVVFPAPPFVALMVAGAAATWLDGASAWADRAWVKLASLLSVALIVLYLVGGRGSERAGLTIHVDTEAKLFGFVRSLPPAVMIAGFPSGEADDIPYVTGRQVFISRENHAVFSKGFADEMRRRMSAFTDAYWASDAAPLRRLRDELGVTHLLVDSRHFGDKPPTYFAPFNPHIKEAFAGGKRDGFFVLRADEAVVFRQSGVTVIDLSKLR
jgi:hypothetical protein